MELNVSPESTDRAAPVQPGRCLNVRSSHAMCRLCADGCPTAAIRLDDTRVEVNRELCVGCGLCLWRCPTAVFASGGRPEQPLVEALHGEQSRSIELLCPQHPVVAQFGAPFESRVPDGVPYLAPRCLSALAPSLLLDFTRVGEREIWLNDLSCPDCPDRAAHPSIVEAASEANGWLRACGVSPKVMCLSAVPASRLGAEPVRRRLRKPRQRATRRGLLGQAASRLRQLGADATTDSSGGNSERRRLLAILAGHLPTADLATAALPLAAVEIDPDRCTGCGICARICPTGALDFLSDDSVFALYFAARACVDCGLCAPVCPEEALTFGTHLPAGRLESREPARLTLGKLAPCSRCGAPVGGAHTAEARRLCHVCRQQSLPSYLIPAR